MIAPKSLEAQNADLKAENERLLVVVQEWGQKLLVLAEISNNDYRRAIGVKPINKEQSNESKHNVFHDIQD